MFCPILPYALLVAVVSVLTTSLFFVAPAALTQRTNVPLHRAVENSAGSVPAFGLRICSIISRALDGELNRCPGSLVGRFDPASERVYKGVLDNSGGDCGFGVLHRASEYEDRRKAGAIHQQVGDSQFSWLR